MLRDPEALCFFVASFIQIIEARKLPPGSCLLEMVNDDLITRGVGARDTEPFGILCVDLGFGFRKTSRSISLFIEDLSIASR